jgi:hypothetical protein
LNTGCSKRAAQCPEVAHCRQHQAMVAAKAASTRVSKELA